MARKSPMLYPFKGIAYLLSNPSLWHRVILPFLILLVITIALLILAFMYLYPLQVDFFNRHNWPHWLGYTVSVLLTLVEAALGSLISYLALMPLWEDALFDAVLRTRKLGYVLDAAHGNYRTCLNGVMGGLYIVFFQSVVLLLFQVVSLIVLLPLHAVPVVGTVVYCYLNGWVMSFSKRIHYDVEICQLSINQSRKRAWKKRTQLCEFGAVAVLLEMTPVLNLLFFWTNVVGAALWVADEIEEARRQDRIATRNSSGQGQEQGSHYVTFHPYDSPQTGLPTEPLLGSSNGYDSYSQAPPQYAQQQQQTQQHSSRH